MFYNYLARLVDLFGYKIRYEFATLLIFAMIILVLSILVVASICNTFVTRKKQVFGKLPTLVAKLGDHIVNAPYTLPPMIHLLLEKIMCWVLSVPKAPHTRFNQQKY